MSIPKDKVELPVQLLPAFESLKQSVKKVFESCGSKYAVRTKKRDIPKLVPLFAEDVKKLYDHYQGFLTILNTASLSEEKRLMLTAKAQRTIQKMTPEAFNRVRYKYYAYMSDQFETHYINHIHGQGAASFVSLYHERITQPHNHDQESLKAIEHKVQLPLDAHLSELVTVLNLTDDEINEALNTEWQSFQQQVHRGEKASHMIPTEQWSSFVTVLKTFIKHGDADKMEQQQFDLLCQQLSAVGLHCEWAKIVKRKIIKRAHGLISKGEWAFSTLPLWLKWGHALISPWITYIIPKDGHDYDANWYNFLREKIKLDHIMYEAYYYTRSPYIFDIIVDYPDSRETIMDLHTAITRRDLFEDFKSELMQQLKTRLLHQGASVTDILHQYIVCIECLKLIDPSCEILAPVMDLIKNYMNAFRKDTARGVVEMIRDINLEDEEELVKFPLDPNDIHVFEEAELNGNQRIGTEDAIPEGRLTILAKLQKKTKDPIAMLISICSSLKEFINNYSDRFGEALLLCTDYSAEEEERRLEYLKRCFPPDVFLRCDIMLQDMANSRRLDKSIHENGAVHSDFHSIVMSAKYWQGNHEDEDIESDDDDSVGDENAVSRLVERYLPCDTSLYRKGYESVKASRKLKFFYRKGSVTLTLDFETRESLRLTVTPEQALIIQRFHSKEQTYTMEQIVQETGISINKAAACLAYWLENNILQLSADGHFSLVRE